MTEGERLADERQALCMTQSQLAERLGVSRGSLARWEQGRVQVPEGLLSLMEWWARETEILNQAATERAGRLQLIETRETNERHDESMASA